MTIQPETWDRFLEGLERYGQIKAAAARVGIGRTAIHEHMKDDPEFAEAVQAARDLFAGERRVRIVGFADSENEKIAFQAAMFLDKLSNPEDFPQHPGLSLGAGNTVVIVSVPVPQRLSEMNVADSFPALDVPHRVVEAE